MSKPFDAVLKELLDSHAIDWIGWLANLLGFPGTGRAIPVDTDLSNVQLTADKVFKIAGPMEFLLHLEPQSSWDGTLADRLLTYNTMLHQKHQLPVLSVVILLRPEANSPRITGTLKLDLPHREGYLLFHYEVIRLWELSAEAFLSGGLGAIPLALLTNDAEGRLEEFVHRIDEELQKRSVSIVERQIVLTSSYILLGLRYNDEEIGKAFQGMTSMRESTTYQAILREGRQEGYQEGRQEGRQEGMIVGRREDLMSILREKFGNLSNDLESRIQQLNDVNVLQRAIRQSVRIARPEDLILE